jgi:hypothetical protein
VGNIFASFTGKRESRAIVQYTFGRLIPVLNTSSGISGILISTTSVSKKYLNSHPSGQLKGQSGVYLVSSSPE